MKPDMTLSEFIAFVASAHKDHFRQDGSPHFVHCIRVMLAVKARGGGNYAQMVAVGHDLLAETWVGPKALRDHCVPSDVIALLVRLSEATFSSHHEYLMQIKKDPILCPVKVADIEDDSNIHELSPIGITQHSLLEKYYQDRKFLLSDTE